MTNNEELELFKKAYSGFRERGEMPFPDQVFNEFLRLRGDLALLSKSPSVKVLDRLFAEHDLDEDRATYIYKDIINVGQSE